MRRSGPGRAFVGVAVEDKPTPGAPAILSAPEIERLVHHYVGDEDAEAIVRELFGAKAPADLSVPELLEMRIRFERLLAASLGAAAARIIVEDHFTISKEEAQQLVTSFQHMQQSLRVTEEEVKRGERLARLGGRERGRLHLHRGHHRPARDHESGGPPAARL